ncbi:MAG: hypothetical protein AUG00_07950, partial [Candidatus Rokubacteria bacterium 13_1_20CM_2_70_7]
MAGLHYQALRRVRTGHTVVGVCDVNLDKAHRLASQASTVAYGDVSTLLAESRPDLVHVCTPAGTHFEPARQALLAGAHVYVEKPFVETRAEADTLFQVAAARRRLICAGHQLVRDPGFVRAMGRVPDLMPVTLVDSVFTFKPPRLQLHRASARALADQLLDILPHALCTLVVALERCTADLEPLQLQFVSATPTELHALLTVGNVVGRLFVSLRARPVASSLTLTGAQGTLTTDFVRSIVLGAANEGTTPLEKIANPFVEGGQLVWRSGGSLARRLLHRGDYPGLAELLEEFYGAVASHSPSPLSVDHLRRVTGLYEKLAGHVYGSIAPAAPATTRGGGRGEAPIAVVTGAAGFFGAAIVRELARRGFRVRGTGRSARPDDPHLHEWVRADLAQQVPPELLANADLVVHAAAETAGAFDAHQRNTVEATRALLQAMSERGVQRLVYISTISVLRPPRSPWEVQAEDTPMPERAAELGAYTWGKCEAEALVLEAQARGHIAARIIRPGALIDWDHIEFPGLLGRRLFGQWYLACGRPGLPFAVCHVRRASAVVAWCAQRFEEAPPAINLFEPAIATRGQLLELFRQRGFRGRMIWVPISLLAGAVVVARTAQLQE